MKKTYIKPVMESVHLQHQLHLLIVKSVTGEDLEWKSGGSFTDEEEDR